MEANDQKVRIKLVKTRLEANANELIHKNKEGDTIARTRINDITEMSYQRKYEPTGFVFFAMGIGLSILASFYIDNKNVGVIVYILSIFLIGFGIIGGVFGKHIVVTKKNGDKLSFLLGETDEEAKAFISSLKDTQEE